MNIYEKLQAVRAALVTKGIKKTARNDFNKFNYFELSDFLPDIQILCNEYKITPVFSICADSKLSMLTIHDNETDDGELDNELIFSMPFETYDVKGANPIQCLGAAITYSRRYLYQIAFEISETDSIDSGNNNKPANKSVENKQTLILSRGADPYEELNKLWLFLGWNKKENLDDYIQKKADKNGADIDGEFYARLLDELVNHINSQKQTAGKVELVDTPF